MEKKTKRAGCCFYLFVLTGCELTDEHELFGFDLPPQPFASMISSLHGPMLTPTSANQPHSLRLRGAVSQLEGPVLRPAKSSLFASASSMDNTGGMGEATSMQTSLTPHTIRQVCPWNLI